MPQAVNMPTPAAIDRARRRLAGLAEHTPVVRLNGVGTGPAVLLKLESLQPVGAFKVRPMGNAVLAADPAALAAGVYTASSGNAGIGLAWIARRLGLAARIHAPDSAPAGKLDDATALGASVLRVADDVWWQIICEAGHRDDPGVYIDAVRQPEALAGNATLGCEIAEQVPDADTIVVPFGGGGLACGVAAGLAMTGHAARLIVAEHAEAAPLTAALDAGRPVPCSVRPSFISGAGSPSVLEEMWPLVASVVSGTVVVGAADVARAVRFLAEQNHVVAEGAGALAVAAVLNGLVDGEHIVCVVSGGNISASLMAAILKGQCV